MTPSDVIRAFHEWVDRDTSEPRKREYTMECFRLWLTFYAPVDNKASVIADFWRRYNKETSSPPSA